MRIRNGNRILSHEAVIEPLEVQEIEVLSFSVMDEEKLQELSLQLHNDLRITGLQAKYNNQPQIPEENSSTNQPILPQANLSKIMEKEEGGGEEDSEKVKESNFFAKNQWEDNSSDSTLNIKLVSSSSSDKAVTGRSVEKDEEITSSSKRIRRICERLKQSEEELAADHVRYEYGLRPRRMGKVIKKQSLEHVVNEKNQKRSSSNVNDKDDNILLIDMLGEEMKRKLMGSLDKKADEKKP